VDGRRRRDHGSSGHDAVGNTSVTVIAIESEGQGLGEVRIEVFIEGVAARDVADLSPAQARQLAALLVEFADRAEA